MRPAIAFFRRTRYAIGHPSVQQTLRPCSRLCRVKSEMMPTTASGRIGGQLSIFEKLAAAPIFFQEATASALPRATSAANWPSSETIHRPP